jgi:hypothetical protein
MIGAEKWFSGFAFLSTANPITHGFYAEKDFSELLQLETKSVRGSIRFLPLVLLDVRRVESNRRSQEVVRGIVSQLFSSTRETDLKGWFRDGSIIGVLFRKIGAGADWPSAQETITRRILVILDTAHLPHPAASWHLLTSSAADQRGGTGVRLETFQATLRTADPKFERVVPKSEYVDLERAPNRGPIP